MHTLHYETKPRASIISILILGVLFFANPVSSAVTLPKVFGDHMVLQRERAVPVWGWASLGENVVVEFSGQRKETTAGPDGRWEIRLEPMPARNEGIVFRVSGSNTNIIEFSDVVVGEVWVCSGEVNMGLALRHVPNVSEDIKNADLPDLRFITIESAIASAPQAEVRVALPWTICSKQRAGECAAVGFYFGRRLYSELVGIPIGLINASMTGSPIEPWTPLEAFDTVPELSDTITGFRKEVEAYAQALSDPITSVETWVNACRKALAEGRTLPEEPQWPIYPGSKSFRKPSAIYNATVYPFIPYAIRGAIWYQGESNDPVNPPYYHKMRALIAGWRRAWAQGDFPFYYVQLPNFGAADTTPSGDGGKANLRQSQFEALSITNTGMAVAIDVGLYPNNKSDAGERLALWALARDYGQPNLVMSGPLYRGLKIEDNRIRLFFDHVGGGLMVGEKTGLEPVREVTKGKLQRFSITGEDQKWVWGEAVIDGETVVVSSLEVPKPIAVRYAYSNNPEGCNLYNRAGLPASPFRTDPE